MSSPFPAEHIPVTVDDVDYLLKVLAALDGHPRSADDFDVWLLATQAGRWTRAELAAAVLAVTRDFKGFRVLPGHVGEQVNSLREQIRHRWNPPAPPRHLAEDPKAEIEWRRRALVNYRERAVTIVAQGGNLADVPLVLDVEPNRALAPDVTSERVAALCADLGREKAVPALEAAPPLDPVRMAAVRADMASRNVAALPAGGDVRRVVLKADRDRDLYVEWSVTTDAATFVGARAEMLEHLRYSAHAATGDTPEERLQRADETGTSATSVSGDEPFGGWDDRHLTVHGLGLLPRERLAAYVFALGEGEAAVRRLIVVRKPKTQRVAGAVPA